jgi:hypothetical protein
MSDATHPAFRNIFVQQPRVVNQRQQVRAALPSA